MAECYNAMSCMLTGVYAKFHELANYAECHYAKCHYAEYHYAECHYGECRCALAVAC
jgi:hypothetical protein